MNVQLPMNSLFVIKGAGVSMLQQMKPLVLTIERQQFNVYGN
jgi:hypothetical protein